jgi:hypothetical protein
MRTTFVVEVLEVVQVRLKIFAGKEDLHVEEFVSELSEEALDVTVLPRRSGLDEAGFDAMLFEEFNELLGAELRTVVEADLLGFAVYEEEPRKLSDEVAASNRRPCLEEKVLSGEDIHDADDTSLTTILKPFRSEVDRPDIAKGSDRRLLFGLYRYPSPLAIAQAKTLLTPDAVNCLQVHVNAQQRMNTPEPKARVLLGQLDDLLAQLGKALLACPPACSPGKPDHLAAQAPGEPLFHEVTQDPTLGGRAHHFPSEISLYASISNA